MKRLDMQATQMVGRRELMLTNYPPPLHSTPPSTFSSLSDARTWLEYLWTNMTESLYSVFEEQNLTCRTTWPPTYTAYKEALAAWSEAFSAYMRTHTLTNSELQASHLLRLQQKTLLLSLQGATEAPDEYENWDAFTPQMEEMVGHAEAVVSLLGETSSPEEETAVPKFSFSLDTGIVVPLYFVGSRSRDPVLRRKAIALCKASRRQEGMWNSALVALVLSRLVEIEERGIDENGVVPVWARITDVEVQLSQDGKGAAIKYLRQISHRDVGKEVFRERI